MSKLQNILKPLEELEAILHCGDGPGSSSTYVIPFFQDKTKLDMRKTK